MENTRIAEPVQEAGAPLTEAEEDQARYALRELARSASDPDALRVAHEQWALVRPFFELGWAMGVRTGHTGPAMADVPIDRATVDRAFMALLCARVSNPLVMTMARLLDPQDAGPVLWQKVRYHGSVARRHGVYWVQSITVHGSPVSGGHELRFDLCELRGGVPVPTVTGVRLQSLTPLPEYRTLV
ncbi:hypothetical protein P8605_02810 [Streptomyces sp. T-3]|nr:hypothetical protein [Streptomyces sp. T-3]